MQKEEVNTPPSNILDVGILQLQNVDVKDLNKNIAKIPFTVICFLSSQQVAGLNVDNLSAQQTRYLVSTDQPQVNKARFERLSSTKVNAIFKDLSWDDMSLLSDKNWKELDVTKFTSQKQIQDLFDSSKNHKENERRFRLLSDAQVDAMLPLLNGYQIRLLSDDHLKKLKVDRLKKEQIQDLFDSNKNDRENERRFGLLSDAQVDAMLPLLNGYQIRLLSDDHLKKLKVDRLKKEQIQDLFDSNKNDRENERRFGLLSDAQVDAMLPLLNGYQIRLLSDDHLKKAKGRPIEKGTNPRFVRFKQK